MPQESRLDPNQRYRRPSLGRSLLARTNVSPPQAASRAQTLPATVAKLKKTSSGRSNVTFAMAASQRESGFSSLLNFLRKKIILSPWKVSYGRLTVQIAAADPLLSSPAHPSVHKKTSPLDCPCPFSEAWMVFLEAVALAQRANPTAYPLEIFDPWRLSATSCIHGHGNNARLPDAAGYPFATRDSGCTRLGNVSRKNTRRVHPAFLRL